MSQTETVILETVKFKCVSCSVVGKDTFFLYLDKIHILCQNKYLDTIQILFWPMYLDKIQIQILIHGIISPILFRYFFWLNTIFIQKKIQKYV